MSQVFWGWSHRIVSLLTCWCLALDVLFSYPDKTLRATLCTQGEGTDCSNVWLMPLSQLSWTAQAFAFAPLTLGTGSTIKAAQSFTSPGWTPSSPWPSFPCSTAQLCSRAQQSCRASYKGAAGLRGEHGETAEAEKPTRFGTGLHYSPAGAQELTPTGTHCHPVETAPPPGRDAGRGLCLTRAQWPCR